MTVIFQSGMLAGSNKEFEVKYVHKERKFLITPQEIDGQIMPNDIYKPNLGDKYAVFGIQLPDSVNDEAGYSRKKSLASETERFKRFGELAAKYGTGIAIENMVDHLGIGYGRRFGCNAEDLLELLDKLNADDIFGICWDTGHANLAQVNQPAAIQQIGSRLKALHINDNRGEKDDHLLPYLGYVEWTPLLKSLADVNYQGDFTYEIHNFTGGMSPEIHQQGVEFSVLVARQMVSEIENRPQR